MLLAGLSAAGAEQKIPEHHRRVHVYSQLLLESLIFQLPSRGRKVILLSVWGKSDYSSPRMEAKSTLRVFTQQKGMGLRDKPGGAEVVRKHAWRMRGAGRSNDVPAAPRANPSMMLRRGWRSGAGPGPLHLPATPPFSFPIALCSTPTFVPFLSLLLFPFPLLMSREAEWG